MEQNEQSESVTVNAQTAKLELSACGVVADDNQINEKGARDYIKAARILADHDETPIGPLTQCQGQAIELALKVCIDKSGAEVPTSGRDAHDLLALHKLSGGVDLDAQQLADLSSISRNYTRDGSWRYPSRYRPSSLRVVTSPGQDAVEELFEAILAQQ